MKQFLKHFILYFSFSIFLTSCKPEPITPIRVDEPVLIPKWNLHPATKGQWFVSNQFYKDSNELNVIGTNFRLILDTAHQIITQKPFTPIFDYDYAKPFVNKSFFVYASSRYDELSIYAQANPNIRKKINITQYGPYFRIVKDLDPPCVVTHEQKMYVPVEDTMQNPSHYFLIFQLAIQADTIQCQLVNRIQIPTTPTQRYIGWSFSKMKQWNEQEIWATGMGMIYHIQLQNNVINPLKSMLYGNFGMIRDTFFAIGSETDIEDAISYNFLPKGQTQWQSFTIQGFSAFYMRWYFIENEIVMVFRDQYLYHFTVNGNTASFKQLHSEGIELIQDLTYFKGRIYIASKQGLYSKSWKDFWTYL